MITLSEYRRLPESRWKGKTVSLLRPIATNGGAIYPAGARAVIVRKLKGFEIRGEPCSCCGVRLLLKQVSPMDLEIVE